MNRRARTIAVAMAALGLGMAVLTPRSAHAQGIGLPGQNQDKPIEIYADEGIEWQQDTKAYIARGNARATQGEVTLHAETLIAYYHDGPQGGTEIWRIDALEKVRIVSTEQTAYGDKAVYDVAKGVLVLTGKPRLVTPTDRITARDSLEYWEARGLVVARGNAMATRGDQTLRADTLTAHFLKGKDNKSKIDRIRAYDNVIITSPKEIVHASRAVYNLKTGIAILTGSVKITRGEDQLNGDKAVVNLKTGISRMLSSGPQRVRGLFKPRRSPGPGAGTGGPAPRQKNTTRP
jgi:lipopolysaccharide export system protein LptA